LKESRRVADYKPLGIQGAWLIENKVFKDSRGLFTEWFRKEELESNIGRPLNIAQANQSQSSYGVIRGIHFSISKQGQAKLITCIFGRIQDFVVDVRKDSPTFRKWLAIDLVAGDGKSIFIEEGLGHAFQSTEENATISYLLSSTYDPKYEVSINPFDPTIGINWPISNYILSDRDANAPMLDELIT
jgi:dTDP-4-dehydrorhamnose 3,5-epimerase